MRWEFTWIRQEGFELLGGLRAGERTDCSAHALEAEGFELLIGALSVQKGTPYGVHDAICWGHAAAISTSPLPALYLYTYTSPPKILICLLIGTAQQATTPHFLRGCPFSFDENGHPSQTCVLYFLFLFLCEWLRCQLHHFQLLFLHPTYIHICLLPNNIAPSTPHNYFCSLIGICPTQQATTPHFLPGCPSSPPKRARTTTKTGTLPRTCVLYFPFQPPMRVAAMSTSPLPATLSPLCPLTHPCLVPLKSDNSHSVL